MDTYNTEVRLTPTQNILIVNVAPESVDGINKILAEHGVQTTHEKSPVRSATMACPALSISRSDERLVVKESTT